MDYMKKLGILKILGINYKKIHKVDDLCGMYAQLDLPANFPFTKKEQSNIKTIQKILKYGKIDNTVIYEHGLYFAMITGLIKGKKRATIVKQEKEIPIHNRKEIKLNYEDLINLGIPKSKINAVYTILENMILKNKLKNDENHLTNYVLKNKKVWCQCNT